MSREFLTPIRLAPLSALPGSPLQGEMVVLITNGHLYVYNGTSWIDCGAIFVFSSVSIDFGSIPQATFTDTFSVSGAITSMNVVISQDGESDEVELAPLACSAYVLSAGVVRLRVYSINGNPFSGIRKFSYLVG